MSAAGSTLDALDRLRRDRPEWAAWLALVEIALREAERPDWDQVVPSVPDRPDREPLLNRTTIHVPAASVRRLWEHLTTAAAGSCSAELMTLRAVRPDGNAVKLFADSLSQQSRDSSDSDGSVDPEALNAVLALLAIPFLHACQRRLEAAVRQDWMEGYCPVCGAWPAFAEARGIDRTRYLRCGRCGSGWHGQVLRCPYCSTTDHEQLATLVPEGGGGRASVEACRGCGGYLKTMRTLQGCAPGTVMLEDLASVDLDLAALEHGYRRPQGGGYPLHVSVEERPSHRASWWRP